MANTVTNTAVVNILSTEDSTNNVLVNRSIQPSMDTIFCGSAFYAQTPDALSHSIVYPLSLTVVKQCYIRNSAPAGAGTSIEIDWQLNGGTAHPVAILGPGDTIFYWMAGTGAAAIGGLSQGITAITYQGSAANIPFEYFLGG